MIRRCSKCGKELADDEVFCSGCGTKFDNVNAVISGSVASPQSQMQKMQKSHELKEPKNIGIALIVLGVVGLFFGSVMYGDIGISAGYAGVVALVTGYGFINLSK